MALLFRAVWNDDREDLFGGARAAFADWVGTRGHGGELPHEGASCLGDGVQARSIRAAGGGTDALRLELIETAPVGGCHTTTLTVLKPRTGSPWIWVDVAERGSAVGGRHLSLAPRFVHDLVASGVDPRVDQVRLTADPHPMPARTIAALVRSGSRSLPLIVFSHDAAYETAVTKKRAEIAQRAFAGAAAVFLLAPDQEAALRTELGDDLAIGGGTARLYLPCGDDRGMRQGRHRAIAPARMGTEPTRAAWLLASTLVGTVTRRRPPECFDDVRRAFQHSGGSEAEAATSADEEIDRLRAEIDQLRIELEIAEEEVFAAQVDLLASEQEIAGLSNRLDALAEASSGDGGVAVSPATAQAAPAQATGPGSIADAIDIARTRLDGIVVPDGVERDIEDLDAHMNAVTWTSSIWRALVALDAYARAHYDGNFRAWCADSGHPRVWPATDKKLAMHESETVQSNERLANQRLLPVDLRVDARGRVHMWAHLKIAEGGGPLAPRIYFHDDTRGPTGKVHVGFVGPHRHMENTKTN